MPARSVRGATARMLLAGGGVPLALVSSSVLVQRLMLPFAVLNLESRATAVLALLAAALLGFVRVRAADRLARHIRLNMLELFLGPFVRGDASGLPTSEVITARLAADMPRIVSWAVDGVALIVAAAVAIPAVIVILASALGARVLVPIGVAGVVGALVTMAASRRVTATWTVAWDRMRALVEAIAAGYEGAVDLRAHGRAGPYAAQLRDQMNGWCDAETRARVASTMSTWGAFGVTLATAAAIVALSGGKLEPAGDPYRTSLLALAAVPTLHTLVAGVGNILSARGALANAARQRVIAARAGVAESDEPIDTTGEIRLEGVGYTYEAEAGGAPVLALQNVDLVLPPRGSVAITGPNGAGKTTLAHVLLGVARPDRGRILVAMQEAPLDNRRFRARVAFLSQRPFELREKTIADNLRAFDAGLPDARLLEVLAAVGLGDSLRARAPSDADVLALPYHALSRGQARRVMLARALLRDTDLLVLDEPEAHLDAASTIELAAILKRIASERRVVAVVHDRQLLTFADHVVELAPPATRGTR